MDNAYKKTLDAILSACPSGTAHPNDFNRVVAIFKKLTEAKKFVAHSDEISYYLRQNGLDDYQSNKVQHIYEVLESIAKDTAGGWNKNLIDEILSS